jgi:hypothetical protein
MVPPFIREMLVTFLFFIGAMLIVSCAELRPACPIVPTYRSATAIDYKEQEEIIRTTTYQAAARSSDVITYYKQQLEQNGWSIRDEDATGFAFSYHTTGNQPPFLLSLLINDENGGVLTYQVSIAIHGPFAWRDWCPSLRP